MVINKIYILAGRYYEHVPQLGDEIRNSVIGAYISSLTHHPHPSNCFVLNLLHPEGFKFTKFYWRYCLTKQMSLAHSIVKTFYWGTSDRSLQWFTEMQHMTVHLHASSMICIHWRSVIRWWPCCRNPWLNVIFEICSQNLPRFSATITLPHQLCSNWVCRRVHRISLTQLVRKHPWEVWCWHPLIARAKRPRHCQRGPENH